MHVERRYLPTTCLPCTRTSCSGCPIEHSRARFDRWVTETGATVEDPIHAPQRYTARRPGVDRSKLTDRECRALDAFVATGGDEEAWDAHAGAWWYAAEWFENRPSTGDSAGERLHAAVVRFMPELPRWRTLEFEAQARWEAAAGQLREARWAA